LAFSLTVALAIAAVNASAQEDPRKLQSAPLFAEGGRLAQQGRNAESLEQFRKAHEIYPSPNTLFNIARQEQVLRQRLAAIRDYREALKNPVLQPQLQTAARQAIAELEGELGRVQVTGPSGTKVTVAGREYELPLQAPIDVDTGMTEVKGVFGTERLSAYVEAHAGSIVTADLRPKGSGDTIVDPPPVTGPSGGSSTARYVVPGIIAGAGLIGIGVGVAFFAKAEGQIDDAVAFRQSVPGGACASLRSATCDEYGAMLDDASSSKDVANGAVIAGGVVIGVAIATFVTWTLWPKRSEGARASFLLVPRASGGGIGGTF